MGDSEQGRARAFGASQGRGPLRRAVDRGLVLVIGAGFIALGVVACVLASILGLAIYVAWLTLNAVSRAIGWGA